VQRVTAEAIGATKPAELMPLNRDAVNVLFCGVVGARTAKITAAYRGQRHGNNVTRHSRSARNYSIEQLLAVIIIIIINISTWPK